MKIHIDFGLPYFDEKAIFELTLNDLDCFYKDENEVNRLNLFFVLEATLHRFQRENNETPEYSQWKKLIDKGN